MTLYEQFTTSYPKNKKLLTVSSNRFSILLIDSAKSKRKDFGKKQRREISERIELRQIRNKQLKWAKIWLISWLNIELFLTGQNTKNFRTTKST